MWLVSGSCLPPWLPYDNGLCFELWAQISTFPPTLLLPGCFHHSSRMVTKTNANKDIEFFSVACAILGGLVSSYKAICPTQGPLHRLLTLSLPSPTSLLDIFPVSAPTSLSLGSLSWPWLLGQIFLLQALITLLQTLPLGVVIHLFVQLVDCCLPQHTRRLQKQR